MTDKTYVCVWEHAKMLKDANTEKCFMRKLKQRKGSPVKSGGQI